MPFRCLSDALLERFKSKLEGKKEGLTGYNYIIHNPGLLFAGISRRLYPHPSNTP
jgi:hypothetical protein